MIISYTFSPFVTEPFYAHYNILKLEHQKENTKYFKNEPFVEKVREEIYYLLFKGSKVDIDKRI